MKALVVGASGLVGGALVRVLERSGVEVVAAGHSRASGGVLALDVRDAEAVERALANAKPDVVFLAVNVPGGVDRCEEHPDEAHAVNVAGTTHVATAAAKHGATLVYYSTDYVFDGKSGPYAEDYAATPVSVYGRTKLEAEQAVLKLAPRHLIVRTTAVYGWDRASRNFAMQVWERLGAGQPMRVPDDQLCNPTLAEYLAEASVRLVQQGTAGIVNVVGKDCCSRADFGRQLARAMALDPALITPTPTSELGQKAARPLQGGLKSDKVTALLGTEPLDLAESLKRFRRQWRSDTHTTGAPKAGSGAGTTEADQLKQEILAKVGRYWEVAHQPAAFVPMKSRVNYAGRVYGPEELVNLVDASLDFWLTLGPWGDLFEAKLRKYLGCRDVVLVNSGSTADLAAVMALMSPLLDRPLRPGDEVITPAVTFPTTLVPLVHGGLLPVFVDCEVGTYNVNPRRLEGAIGPRTRAIMVPHTLGNPCDLDVVMDLAKRHDLYLIEDTCDALGGTWRGKPLGTFGDLATLSFFPAHHITMGEGGAVVVNNPKLAKIVRSVRDWGRDCFPAATSVICRDAVRPIESVEVGHEVLTHEGRWRAVIRLTGHRSYTRPLVTIRARRRPPITASATHPFWVRRNGHRQWVQASDLHRGDELIARTYPTGGFPPSEFRWSYGTLSKEAVPNSVPVEPDLMRLVGYWLAEGSLAAYRVEFAFHERETEFIADVKSLMARYFGCTGRQRQDARSHGVSLTFKSRRAYEFFLQTIGRGAHRKRLPPWMLELPDKHIAELLRGHWRGDGSASRQGFVVHSVSAELIEQVRLLMMRFGILASQWKRAADRHALSVYGVNAERFAEAVGERYDARTPKRQAAIDEATGEAFFPVIEVRPFTPDQPVDVYNLEVEGDNSYHAAGVAAHNCWCAPGESNTCGKRFGWELGELPRGYDHKYIYSTLGYNFKPTDMQAAIGVAQLDRLPGFIEKRRENFRRLYEALAPFQDGLILPTLDPRANPSWFSFPITVREGVSRAELVHWLETANIETRQVFGGNILKQPGYRDIPRRVHGTLEQTDRIMRDTFFVGVYPGMTPAMIDVIVDRIGAFFSRRERDPRG